MSPNLTRIGRDCSGPMDGEVLLTRTRSSGPPAVISIIGPDKVSFAQVQASLKTRTGKRPEVWVDESSLKKRAGQDVSSVDRYAGTFAIDRQYSEWLCFSAIFAGGAVP